MIGKLIPAGTGFEPGQFTDEIPGGPLDNDALEGRVLDLFESGSDDMDLFDDEDLDEIDELDADLLEDDEDETEDGDLDDDFEEEDPDDMD
jgi:hypothetical protein